MIAPTSDLSGTDGGSSDDHAPWAPHGRLSPPDGGLDRLLLDLGASPTGGSSPTDRPGRVQRASYARDGGSVLATGADADLVTARAATEPSGSLQLQRPGSPSSGAPVLSRGLHVWW